MSTDETDIRLGLFLDGELTEAEIQALHVDLEASEDLRERLERLKRASQELQNFYTDSQMIHSANETDKDIVVERIVRESTMQGRRSAIDRKNRRGPSNILISTIGITVLAAVFLLLRTWFGGEPEALELVEGARLDMTSGYFEADVKIPALLETIQSLDPMISDQVPSAEFRLRSGPDGLFNVRLKNPETSEVIAHIGFDGKQAFVWRAGEESIRLLSKEEVEADHFVSLIFGGWRRVKESLDQGTAHPEALKLVGKVKDAAVANEHLWKVRMSGPSTNRRAKYWFDDKGKLRRVEAAGVQFDINQDANLSGKDFEIQNILPGKSTKEDL